MISNETYTYEDITGLLQRVELHVGLRTHTLIFCASVCTPMINISSYPKSLGFMRSIGQEDKFISFDNLNPDYVVDQVRQVWAQRTEIRTALGPVVAEEKRKARDSAGYLSRYLA